MQFKLPEDGPIYTEHIISRSRDLITHNIWQGIDEIRLSRWLKNFRTEKQRYFAARVLDSLIYRSDAQTKSMLTHLFQRTIPDIARQHGLPPELYTALDRLQSKTEPNFSLVPVVPSTGSTMASGSLIARIISRHLRIQRKRILGAHEIRRTTPFVVFIDDFVGTGNQFTRFIHQQNLDRLVRNKLCCYVAIAGHSVGIGNLKKKFPKLPISAVDLLGPRNSLFDRHSLAFPDGTNSIADAKSFCHDMLDEFGIGSRKYRDGYGGLALAYAFDHAIPNNCTPLLWWPPRGNWTPLFDR